METEIKLIIMTASITRAGEIVRDTIHLTAKSQAVLKANRINTRTDLIFARSEALNWDDDSL